MRTARIAKLIAALALFLLALPSASAPAATGASTAATGGTGAGDIVPVQYRSLTEAVGVLGRRTLRRGSRGADVIVLQRLLRELKYSVRVTGVFDRRTERAVKRFQRSRRIEMVGFVGPQTARALRAAHASFVSPKSAQPPQPPPAVQTDGWVFPIRGRHDYGDEQNRFGADRGGRSHAGQDVLAACGTPLVAARGGKVLGADSGGGAGNFVAVDTGDTRYDYFYAHLRDRALVSEGQTVKTGQLVGYVGSTGSSTACHLHFELWDGPWWNGGRAIDPLPFLKAWDK